MTEWEVPPPSPQAQRIDRQLREWSERLELLLYLTPVNTMEAWRSFRRVPATPVFLYRDSVDLSWVRDLESLDIGVVPEPHFRVVLEEYKQALHYKVDLASARNDSRLMIPCSRKVYGPIEDGLVETARVLLGRIPRRDRQEERRTRVKSAALLPLAVQEIEQYKEAWPDFGAEAEIREDVHGILVSKGRLLIGASYATPKTRVVPLLHHEIGTHCLTYANGTLQPLSLFASGLHRYEALQEGIAVLSEHLCGGLRRPRLRLLAGRVLAARSVEEGASWMETYLLLRREYGFTKRLSFNITTRVHRGGGLLKDAIYLQGLIELLSFLREGGDLISLLLGRMGFAHIPWVQQGVEEGWLASPRLLPRYLDTPGAQKRLERLRQPIELHELITEPAKTSQKPKP